MTDCRTIRKSTFTNKTPSFRFCSISTSFYFTNRIRCLYFDTSISLTYQSSCFSKTIHFTYRIAIYYFNITQSRSHSNNRTCNSGLLPITNCIYITNNETFRHCNGLSCIRNLADNTTDIIQTSNLFTVSNNQT